jgi:hypothetical protein
VDPRVDSVEWIATLDGHETRSRIPNRNNKHSPKLQKERPKPTGVHDRCSRGHKLLGKLVRRGIIVMYVRRVSQCAADIAGRI